MNGNRFRALVSIACAVLVAELTARADEGAPSAAETSPSSSASSSAPAAAEALFTEGRRLISEGRYAEGCTKLEQSQRLDPAAGTQLNLADCYERSGKLATAWVAFHEAAALAKRTGRAEWAEQARERARVLEPSVPTLMLVISEPYPGLELRSNGVNIAPVMFGAPIPLNPGIYEITAEAPGRRPWSTRILVEASARVVLHVPDLVQGAPSQTQNVPGQPSVSDDRRPSSEWSHSNVQRNVALTLGAAGIVWAVVGAYLGVTAIMDNNEAAWRCPSSPRCTDERAVVLTSNAQRAADASTVAFIASGTLFTTSAVLFLTARHGLRPSVAVRSGGADVVLRADW